MKCEINERDMTDLNNIILAFSVVFPLMLMMFVGYILRRRHITDEPSLQVMNKMVFRFFLPLLLFLNIYSLKPEEAMNKANSRLLILAFLCIIGAVVLTHLILSLFIKDKKKRSVMIQGIFRSNLVIFGIPITASIYGDDRIGIVSMLAAFVVPLFNILAVVVLESYRGSRVNIKQLLIGLIKNPLIIVAFLGFLCQIIRWQIPDFYSLFITKYVQGGYSPCICCVGRYLSV